VVQPLAFSTEEFEYMKKNSTVELPPNFVHKVLRLTDETRKPRGPGLVWNKVKHFHSKKPAAKGKAVRTKFRFLQFRGHLVTRDVFPHNILLMKDGAVVFATDFKDSIDLGKDTFDVADIRIIGYKFNQVILYMNNMVVQLLNCILIWLYIQTGNFIHE
jgi:serine/threonine protein kinase